MLTHHEPTLVYCGVMSESQETPKQGWTISITADAEVIPGEDTTEETDR